VLQPGADVAGDAVLAALDEVSGGAGRAGAGACAAASPGPACPGADRGACGMAARVWARFAASAAAVRGSGLLTGVLAVAGAVTFGGRVLAAVLDAVAGTGRPAVTVAGVTVMSDVFSAAGSLVRRGVLLCFAALPRAG